MSDSLVSVIHIKSWDYLTHWFSSLYAYIRKTKIGHKRTLMSDQINQNLTKYGPHYSLKDLKQRQIVSMIKRYEVNTELRSRVNLDIAGLRKKKTPFAVKPNNRGLWESFSTFERNGMINVGISRNWARLIWPTVPVFFFVYMAYPMLRGHQDNEQYMNYQH